MLVTLTFMLLFSLILGSLHYIQSVEQSTNTYRTIHEQNVARFHFIVESLTKRYVVWAESLNELVLKKQNKADSLSEVDFFQQFHWQISQSWLISASGNIVYGDAASLPTSGNALISRSQKLLEPVSRIDCVESVCNFYVAVPMLDKSIYDSYTYLTKASMQELLALLGETTQSKVALVIVNANTSKQLDVQFPEDLRESHLNSLEKMLGEISQIGLTGQELLKNGGKFEIDGRQIYVSFIPLDSSTADLRGSSRIEEPFLMIASDITDIESALITNQSAILLSIIFLFIVCGSCIYLLLFRYGKKLVALSELLPLLAEGKYKAFRKDRRVISTKDIYDELDILDNAATELAFQLEELDKSVEQKSAALSRMAMLDSLTGLANRNALNRYIDDAIASLTSTSETIALLFIDLDDFKKVNDSYGHDIGDRLLFLSSKKIEQSSESGCLIARFGGDEFVVLLTQSVSKQKVLEFAKKLIETFKDPINIEDLHFHMTLSIGVAVSSANTAQASELLRHADIAMYEAKRSQGSSFEIFNTTMNLAALKKVELENEARTALKESQFYIALQPQLRLSDYKLRGLEVLLRWKHPEKGLIPPNEFIPALENSAFMKAIDFWVLEQGILQLTRLNKRGYDDVLVSINISAAQFMDSNFTGFLRNKLKQYNVLANRVELELTETALVNDIEKTTEVMKELKALGCRIAIDDFGTGYSSLSYLKSIPADIVKIDKSFISGIMVSESDSAIVSSTIKMVGSLGLEVVAEGIESQEQSDRLKEFQCKYGQGYLISKPIDEFELLSIIKKRYRDGVWKIE